MPPDSSFLADIPVRRVRRRHIEGELRSGPDYWEELRTLALSTGVHAVGVAPAGPMLRARAALNDRVSRGLTNGMQFTFRDIERSTTPQRAVDGAKSIIVAALSYSDNTAVPNRAAETDGVDRTYSARVASYAWADFHHVLKNRLTVVSNKLRLDGHAAVIFADDNSIVDREAARLAGIGWFGKNANILLPKHGSFFVLGCIVTTADLPHAQPLDDGCGSCTRCLPACPTSAIIEPGVIDAHRCLSWLLQKPGIFPREYREALHDRIYGCDDCQTSCPPTIRKSIGVTVGADALRTLDVLWMLTTNDESLLEKCDPWYVHQRDAKWLRRNALVILGNIGDGEDPRVRFVMRDYLSSADPLLRTHAVWAAARLGLHDLLPSTDTDEMVRAELANLPTLRGAL